MSNNTQFKGSKVKNPEDVQPLSESVILKIEHLTQDNYLALAEVTNLEKEIAAASKELGISADPQMIREKKIYLEKSIATALASVEKLEQEYLKEEQTDDISYTLLDEIINDKVKD
jgi:hypothetical protein